MMRLHVGQLHNASLSAAQCISQCADNTSCGRAAIGYGNFGQQEGDEGVY